MTTIETLRRTLAHKKQVLAIHMQHGNAFAVPIYTAQIEALALQIEEIVRNAERDEEREREADERETLRSLRREMGPLGGGI